MTPLERYERALARLRKATDVERTAREQSLEFKAVVRAVESANRAREALVAECPHPAAYVRQYSWHHGYGKYVRGDECTLCNKRRSHSGMGLWSPPEHFNRRDDD